MTTPAATEAGVILGTAAYMAPEQARGQPVDKRADIWAFGSVLYEMLVGRRAFDGADTAARLAAVVRDDPDWNALPEETPAAIRRLLRRCLTKDRARRLADIGDARLDLDDAQTDHLERRDPSTAVRPPRGTKATSLVSRLAWLSAGAALASVTLLLNEALAPSSPAPLTQQQRITDAAGNEEFPALSPDGRSIAFIATRDGRRQVFVRLLAGGAEVQLTRDDLDHEQPRWTPDSLTILYFTPGRTTGKPGTIWEIPASAGPRVL
jgi:serine/threonine protein kinase